MEIELKCVVCVLSPNPLSETFYNHNICLLFILFMYIRVFYPSPVIVPQLGTRISFLMAKVIFQSSFGTLKVVF